MHIHGPQHRSKPWDFVAIRQVLVALLLFFHEAHRRADDFGTETEDDGLDEFDMQEDDWKRMVQMGVIHRAEVKELKPLTAEQRVTVLLQRSASFVQRSLMEAHAPPSYVQAIFQSLSTVHQEMERVIVDIKFPLPYPYFHLMQTLLTVNLTLLAYIFARNMSFWAPVLYVMSMLAYMGLRDISTNVQNPFGNDIVDYPMKDWIDEVFLNLNALMRYDHEARKEIHTNELEAEATCRTRFCMSREEVDYLLAPPWDQVAPPRWLEEVDRKLVRDDPECQPQSPSATDPLVPAQS
jgi:hypothetical protein